MTRHSPSRGSGRTARLVAGLSTAIFASVWVAPVVGGQAPATTGTWTIQPSPDPRGALASELQAVSCSGPDRCLAVGSSSYRSGGQLAHQRALVERLADHVWTIVPTPAIDGATSSALNDVSCPLADFCVAVGSVQLAVPPSPGLLAETWNGTSWSVTVLPVPSGGTEPALVAVSCPTQGSCVAVGNFIDDKTDTVRPLAERLGGGTWTMVPAPVPPHGGGATGNSEFTDVDCPTATQCEVVGIVGYNDTLQNVFAYGLSGSTWTYQTQVNPGPDPGNTDAAVACSDADVCTSVGSVSIVGDFALVEFWNGLSWVRQVAPAPVNRPDDTLSDVSCDGGASCVAVGESFRVDQTNGHLIDGRVMGVAWNGTTWSQAPPVVPSGFTATINGISCPVPTACVAVGSASTPSSASTLVEAFAS
jgi:hypothetical protein